MFIRSLFPSDPETLDGAVIRRLQPTGGFGWRWAVSGLFLTLLLAFFLFLADANYRAPWKIGGTEWSALEFATQPDSIVALIVGLGTALFWFKTQIGWVLAKTIVSATLVVFIIGLIVQFIPGIEPNTTHRTARILVSIVAIGLTGFTFYLLSHQTLRGGFRIPNSWVWRCVTLGGVIGMVLGGYLTFM